MGNRAIIKPVDKNIGVYLHWNGGRDSVEAFLKYCELRGFRSFGGKHADGYGIARFVQVVSNFFEGSLCIGICTGIEETEECAKWIDNGIYVIDGWNIVKRIPEYIIEQNDYDLQEMLLSIDEAQPYNDQLTKDFIEAKEVPTDSLGIGDEVFIYDDTAYREPKCKIYKIVGIGKNKCINGYNVNNVPYTNKYPNLGADNINNYLLDKTYRKAN